MFKQAIVRRPCKELIHGISTAKLGVPDYKKALKQHDNYIEALQRCGLIVNVLEEDDRFPDSVFVEDVAICTPKCVIITRPGAVSRKNETESMVTILSDCYKNIEVIYSPGTLEGGDVMMVGDCFYIGLSERTNEEGASQLIHLLNKYGMRGITIPVVQMLHLKTGLSYIEKNNLLLTKEYISENAFSAFNRIHIHKDEKYAANSLWINDNVIVPLGYPKTRKQIEQWGYPTIEVDVSEFQKIDGGLSCLSLRF